VSKAKRDTTNAKTIILHLYSTKKGLYSQRKV